MSVLASYLLSVASGHLVNMIVLHFPWLPIFSMPQYMTPVYFYSPFSMNSFLPALLSTLQTHVTFSKWSVLKSFFNTLSRTVFSGENSLTGQPFAGRSSQEPAMRMAELVVLQVCNHFHLKVYDQGLVTKKNYERFFKTILPSQKWTKMIPRS